MDSENEIEIEMEKDENRGLVACISEILAVLREITIPAYKPVVKTIDPLKLYYWQVRR